MTKQFYEKALPSKGVYCASGINGEGQISQKFAESLDDLFNHIASLTGKNLNVYVTPGTFKDYNRQQVNAAYVKSFFVDLDVIVPDKYEAMTDERKAKEKCLKYDNKGEAVVDLDRFITEAELPPPVIVDSGTGIQAYWIFNEEVPAVEWLVYARKFKSLCKDLGLKADPACTADSARYMRCVGSFNQKHNPPREVKLLTDDINTYDFELFKDYLGVEDTSLEAILQSVPKGIDDDTRSMLNWGDRESLFQTIAERSAAGTGCNQIKYIIANIKTLSYDMWRAGLSIAVRCEDGADAIHWISEGHPDYDYDRTVVKAKDTKAHFCETFDNHNPGGCDGCPFRGKISTPLDIGRTVKQAPTTAPNAVWKVSNPQTVPPFPKGLAPFFRGAKGGIWYKPPPTVDKKGGVNQDDDILIFQHDLFPVKRMYSPIDGETLLMRCVLPNDAAREFPLPMKYAYMQDEFKKIIASTGVLFNQTNAVHLMNYVIKWGQFLVNSDSAEQMRMQMGWTEAHDAFVVGQSEIYKDGTTRQTPPSPFVRGLAKLLKPVGSYDEWKKAANSLNEPGFELHAFTMMCGFGSTLMNFTSTNGVSIALVGDTGAAKTGALNAAQSIFGNPKELNIFDATDNGMVGRYLGLHSILLGCDEVSNRKAELLSQLIHRISHGKSKIRMQASVNAERELELSASLIGVFTSNQSIYDKLSVLKASPDGEVARLVEFMVKTPRPLVVNPDRGKEIFDAFNFHYGYAGPEFIKYVYKVGFQRVIDLLDKWSTLFQRDFGPEVGYRFYGNLISAVFAAAELAVEAGIVDITVERVYRFIILEMLAIRDNTIRVNSLDYKSLIGEFINKFHAGILILDGDRVTTEPHTHLIGRIEIHNRMQYVSSSALREYLNSLGVSSREFKTALKLDGILVFEGKQRLSNGWKAGMTYPPIAVLGFRIDSSDAAK